MKLSDLPERQQGYALLRQQGLSISEAAKAVGYRRGSAYQVEHKLKNLAFVTDARVKRAHSVMDKLMRGKAWGSISHVKDSTAMAAAAAVIDRAEPKVTRTENLNLNATISPVDLSRYRASGREAREVAREATVDVQGIADVVGDG